MLSSAARGRRQPAENPECFGDETPGTRKSRHITSKFEVYSNLALKSEAAASAAVQRPTTAAPSAPPFEVPFSPVSSANVPQQPVFRTPSAPSSAARPGGRVPMAATPATPAASAPQRTPRSTPLGGATCFTPASQPAREPLKVYCRVRPFTNEEIRRGEQNCVEVESDKAVTMRAGAGQVTRVKGGRYTFTGVFDGQASQQSVFKHVALPLVRSLLSGANAMLVAYGMTNAGKTYTITGRPNAEGILPRILDVIFASINKRNSVPGAIDMGTSGDAYDDSYPLVVPVGAPTDLDVFISYLEIYNEKVNDLLSSEEFGVAERKVRQTEAGQVFVEGLTQLPIASTADGYHAINKGLQNRKRAQTQANADSSRSHSMTTITLSYRGQQHRHFSKMCVIDLAGSERTNKTQASGMQQREAANINKSLTTFGRCLDVLRQNQQNPQRKPEVVPFRDSNLTRLLSDFFVGNGQGVMIVNISPAAGDFDENCQSLKFAAIASEITTANLIDTRRAKLPRPDAETDVGYLGRGVEGGGEDGSSSSTAAERLRRYALEDERNRIEAVVRQECSSEMERRIQELEGISAKRMLQEAAKYEEKYETKVKMLQLHYDQQTKAHEDEKATLHMELELLTHKLAGAEARETKLKNTVEELQSEVTAGQITLDRELAHWRGVADELRLQLSHLESELKCYKRENVDLQQKSNQAFALLGEHQVTTGGGGGLRGVPIDRSRSAGSILPSTTTTTVGRGATTPKKRELLQMQAQLHGAGRTPATPHRTPPPNDLFASSQSLRDASGAADGDESYEELTADGPATTVVFGGHTPRGPVSPIQSCIMRGRSSEFGLDADGNFVEVDLQQQHESAPPKRKNHLAEMFRALLPSSASSGALDGGDKRQKRPDEQQDRKQRKKQKEGQQQAKRDQKKADKENKVKGLARPRTSTGEWSGFVKVEAEWGGAGAEGRKRPSYSDRDALPAKRQKSDSPPANRDGVLRPTTPSSRKAAQKPSSATPVSKTPIAKRVKPLNKNIL